MSSGGVCHYCQKRNCECERIDAAFAKVKADPDFHFGDKSLSGAHKMNFKRFVIETYEKLTGKAAYEEEAHI